MGDGEQKGMSSCAPAVVRDYERVLRRLPPLPRPRANGALPFGPRGLFIHQPQRRIFVPGDPGSQKYRFLLTPYGPGGRVLDLGWTVKGRLSRIDQRGESHGTEARAEWVLGRIKAARLLQINFGLRVPAKAGIYRVELEFDDTKTGKAIGRVAQYLRVMKPRVHPRLRVIGSDGASARREVLIQLENLGTRELVDNNYYELMREEGGLWVPVRDESGEVAALGRERFVYGGLTGDCERIVIPGGAVPGRYRVSRPVWVGSSRRILNISGTFRLVD